MADANVLGAFVERRAGSSPVTGTKAHSANLLLDSQMDKTYAFKHKMAVQIRFLIISV